jgi:hypothetical protein
MPAAPGCSSIKSLVPKLDERTGFEETDAIRSCATVHHTPKSKQRFLAPQAMYIKGLKLSTMLHPRN